MINKPPVGDKGVVPVNVLTVTASEHIALPVYYTNYGIFIPAEKNSAWDYYRLFIVKYLLTLAERIAEI